MKLAGALSFSRKAKSCPDISQTGNSFSVAAGTGEHGQPSFQAGGGIGNRIAIIALDKASIMGRVGAGAGRGWDKVVG